MERSLRKALRLEGWGLGLAITLLAAAYGALQNGLWWPGSDSEVYLSVARSLAQGEGYRFNGQPIPWLTPGYPMLLALLFTFTSSFWVISLLNMILLLAWAAIWWCVIRRLSNGVTATLVIIVVGLLFDSFRLSVLAFTDPLYGVMFASSVLLAITLQKDADGGYLSWPQWLFRAVAMLGLLVLSCAVRPVGVMNWLVPAAFLVGGLLRPRLERHWLLAAMSGVCSIATYLAIKWGVQTMSGVQATVAEEPAMEVATNRKTPRLYDYVDVVPLEMIQQTPVGISELFWPPLRIAAAAAPVALLSTVVGSVALLVFALFAMHRAFRRGEAWGLAVLALVLVLGARRGEVNPRYLLQFTPLLLLGVVCGLRTCIVLFGGRSGTRHDRLMVAAVLATILLANLPLLFMEVRVARSHDFYGHYRAGQSADMLRISEHLRRNAEPRDTVATNSRYTAYGSLRSNTLTVRELHLLTRLPVDRIRMRRLKDDAERSVHRTCEFARGQGYDWYVHRPEPTPWRIYHFRAPGLQERITNEKPVHQAEYFVLYRITDTGHKRVILPQSYTPIERVPLLGSRVSDFSSSE